ncbi:pyridoxal phosphate-dependent aminotransferase [Paradevosia shaoguanensis]|uniref:Aminotransferase n=1 Tax=Paradevosia shaoguanensis TaxID=1335043 RepID=A0AA41QIJ0_9HYPH|nr:pyridoxal phosphate-dependent aminotransferase [Paradevosia shaoguanensis]MCF1741068.1 pyridoxal phosphate-dependent aminotransferase [Paradevosia shaoguanensis]MCI0125551.1 pyridoxal phosphate-dependent aminotransferase [Paradevosia shaoguanensis]
MNQGWANARGHDPLAGIRDDIRNLPTENIAELALKAASLSGVIPLWYGEGDLVTPQFIRDAAKAALDQGMTFYVPDMRGLPALTSALSDYQTRLHGVDIPVQRSTVTPSGMHAVLLALELIVDKGDEVIFIEPQWPNIRSAIQLVGGVPVPFGLDFRDGDWRLDLERLMASCTSRTRAIFLPTPSNPAGWVASVEENKALLEFSRRTGIWILSDEVYARLYFDGEVAPSMLQIAEDGDRVLAINSFSKAWAMTGWRIGWLTHPSSVAGALGGMTQYMNSGTAGFIQAGAAAALTQGEPLVREIRERCRVGRDLAYEKLAPLPQTEFGAPPKGGMYVFFALKGEDDAKAACRHILESARVGLAPGHLFGEASKRFLRVCICRDAAQLSEAFDRIAKVLNA